jgi:hypothetical protein
MVSSGQVRPLGNLRSKLNIQTLANKRKINNIILKIGFKIISYFAWKVEFDVFSSLYHLDAFPLESLASFLHVLQLW